MKDASAWLQPWWFQWDFCGGNDHKNNWGEAHFTYDSWVVHHQVAIECCLRFLMNPPKLGFPSSSCGELQPLNKPLKFGWSLGVPRWISGSLQLVCCLKRASFDVCCEFHSHPKSRWIIGIYRLNSLCYIYGIWFHIAIHCLYAFNRNHNSCITI